MTPRILVLLALGLVVAMPVRTATAQDWNFYDNLATAPPDFLLKVAPGAYEALPAVYRVYVFGSGTRVVPKSVEVKLDLLEQDAKSIRESGTVPAEVPQSAVKWVLAAKQPERYLVSSQDVLTLERKDQLMGFGSCYAIDRRGLLLTNRHVIEDSDKPLEAESLLNQAPPALVQMLETLVKAIGPWEGSREGGEVLQQSLLSWFAGHTKSTKKVTRVMVAVSYTELPPVEKGADAIAAETAVKLFGLPVDARRPVLLPVTVIARGGTAMVEDIALLRIDGKVTDALICLKFSVAGDIRPGAPAISLGFPGYRYDFGKMRTRDFASVNLQPGSVTFVPQPGPLTFQQRTKLRLLMGDPNEHLLVVSARIRPGSSGGPLILEDGTVAGMNVAFQQVRESAEAPGEKRKRGWAEEAIAQGRRNVNLAVSLPRIQKFLEEQKIVPDLGPTTADWHAAVAAYRAGDLPAAHAKLSQIEKRQRYVAVVGKPYGPAPPAQHITSHYVEELLKACAK